MEQNKYNLDLALEVINLKIADTIKNNTGTSFSALEEEVIKLKNEREEIYKNNEEVINKVLTVYLNQVKK